MALPRGFLFISPLERPELPFLKFWLRLNTKVRFSAKVKMKLTEYRYGLSCGYSIARIIYSREIEGPKITLFDKLGLD